MKEEVKAAEEVVQEVKEELPPPPAEPVVEGYLLLLFLLRNNHDFLSRSYEYHYLGYDSYMPTLWHFVSKYEADVSKSLII